VAGGFTVLGFMVIHDLWISDIWFSVGRMVFAGALCGLCIVWSYNTAALDHSVKAWFAYNGVIAGLLIGIGGVSFLVLDPKFTMAEAMLMDDALAVLMPPAMPLMIGASLIGTGLLWMIFGRHRRSIIPILVTQTLLVFLVGHNLAILGLVEMTSSLLTVGFEFVGLTVYLAGGLAVGVIVIARGFALLTPLVSRRR